MLARCYRCQGTFTTDRFGTQTCPNCGSELVLPDPNAAAGGTPPQPPAEPPRPPPGQGEPPAAPQPPSASQGPSGGWGAPPPPGGWGPPPPPPPPAGELPSPFAERAQRGFVAAFFETWKLVATQPQQFFGRVRIDQTGTAVLFGVIASTVGSAAAALYGYFSGQQAIVALQQMAQNMPEDQARIMRMYMQLFSGGTTIAQVVLAPLLAVLGMYVYSAILHLLLMLFRGASRGFDATLTAVAYSYGLYLLLAVPACGGLLGAVWMTVVLIIGLGAIHRCGPGKAAAAVLAPAALACICCCGALGISGPALLKGLKEGAQHAPTTNL